MYIWFNSFIYYVLLYRNVQWTDDETFFSRMVTGEVHFYDSKRLDKGIHDKLRLENIGDFSISPGKSPSIAVFIPEKNVSYFTIIFYFQYYIHI